MWHLASTLFLKSQALHHLPAFNLTQLWWIHITKDRARREAIVSSPPENMLLLETSGGLFDGVLGDLPARCWRHEPHAAMLHLGS
ncbi:MAG: hypothetical protein ACJAV4_001069, partial [Pontimonas sp.]